jgi:hypothetical protein
MCRWGTIIAAQKQRPVVFGLKARNVTARAAGPGNTSNQILQPCKGETKRTKPQSNLIPRISLIQRLAILLTKPAIFGLKILLFVVFRLVANIFSHRLDMHRADAELAITRLPRKIRIPWVLCFNPTGRRRFDLLHKVRRSMIFRLCEQDVNMVAHGINFDERRIKVFENTRNIGMELATFFVTEKLTAILCAEYEMNNDVGEGLGHGFKL